VAEPLKAGQRAAIRGWVAALVVLYCAITAFAVDAVRGEKREAERNHALRMSSDGVEPGLTAPDPLPTTGDFVVVHAGIYVEDIDTMSIRDSFWSTTFFLWFRWTGDKGLDPAKSFLLVDARIDKREVVEQYFGDDGTNYQRVKVAARMFKTFNTMRVPLDDHVLTISIEDAARDGFRLRFVADEESGYSSRLKITGYKVTSFRTVVKNHTYRSTYGDPRAESKRKTFTELVAGLAVKRASMGLYLKLLLALFAGCLLTLASFYIRPSDTSPRFSLPTASYFGAVANSYLIGSQVPSSGQFGLVDYIGGLGLLTISLCVGASLYSGYHYIIRKDESYSRAIDAATRRTVFIVYALANIVLPLSAFVD
jgi:hypothetical protein